MAGRRNIDFVYQSGIEQSPNGVAHRSPCGSKLLGELTGAEGTASPQRGFAGNDRCKPEIMPPLGKEGHRGVVSDEPSYGAVGELLCIAHRSRRPVRRAWRSAH